MKSDPDLPRVIALAVLAVLIFMACVPGHAGMRSETDDHALPPCPSHD